VGDVSRLEQHSGIVGCERQRSADRRLRDVSVAFADRQRG
jgi:hypothetical protein